MLFNEPHNRPGTPSRHRHWILVLAMIGAGSLRAQPMPANHAGHQATTTAPGDASLPAQVEALKAKVAQLDEALRRTGATTAPTTAPTASAGGMAGMAGMSGAAPMPAAAPPAGGAMAGMAPMPSGGAMPAAGGMPGMSGNGGMGDMMQMMGGMMQQMGGMMKMDGMAPKPGGGMAGGMSGGMGGEMAGMGMGMSGGAMPGASPPTGAMQGMPMPPKPPMQNMPAGMASMKGMDGMMGMPPAAAMANSAALPGFPGASHIYHIGADEFFLNHDQHITLTTQQRTALTMAKEKSLMDKASAERGIAQAEQDLWQLTSADQPEAAKIEAKIAEIGKLRGDERMNFIRAVGEAAKLLSPEQIKQLLGQLPPAMPQPAAPMAPGMSGGMGHM